MRDIDATHGRVDARGVTAEHTIWFAVYDDIQTLDLAGPMEMFSTAGRLIESTGRAGAGYRLRVVHPWATSIHTAAGLRITPEVIGDRAVAA